MQNIHKSSVCSTDEEEEAEEEDEVSEMELDDKPAREFYKDGLVALAEI